MTTVDAAYTEVERLTRARARNFAYGIMLLPKPKRRAIAAIYAFAREVDDVADDPGLEDEVKRERLEELRAGVDGGAKTSAMFVALADARRRFAIPCEALHDMIDGGLQDTEQARYATFEDLLGYCRRVAGAVGVACVAVYGANEPQRAETLGVALQLINIIRDVAEDWSLGRVYLPQDELAEFGVSEADIAARRCSTRVARAHGAPGETGTGASRRGPYAAAATRPPQRGVRRDICEPLRDDAGPDRRARLRRLRRASAALALTKLRIVGAGLLR